MKTTMGMISTRWSRTMTFEKTTKFTKSYKWLDVKLPSGAVVRDAGVQRSVVKQTSLPLSEGVENFEELREAFIGTDRATDFIE